MRKQHPDKWTEELMDELPSVEDDRYEWKSGEDLFDPKKYDEFFNKLGQEICAFANSFGGTLFLGIDNKRNKLGIPSIGKGKAPMERWLENQIPNLLELRLQHFRVLPVELTPKTQSTIGTDRVIISIDVFESELAPHQCTRNKLYYYRVNSESKPAPHHYLAFLWGRNNSNMSNVATWWLKEFFDPLIQILKGVKNNFLEKAFLITPRNPMYDNARTYAIDFFELEKLDGLLTSDIGEYILYKFPLIEKELLAFRKQIDDFYVSLQRFENTIRDSSYLNRAVKETYERLISHQHITHKEPYNGSLEQLIKLLLGEMHYAISNHPSEATENAIRVIAYRMLGLNIDYNKWYSATEIGQISVFHDLVRDVILENSVAEARHECSVIFDKIQIESTTLWESLNDERMNIATRYCATFGKSS